MLKLVLDILVRYVDFPFPILSLFKNKRKNINLSLIIIQMVKIYGVYIHQDRPEFVLSNPAYPSSMLKVTHV